MKTLKNTVALVLCIISIFSLASCSKVDPDYGVESSATESTVSEAEAPAEEEVPKIMSMDQVMPLYFDISDFDEENYSEIYLGEDFKINAKINGKAISVPAKIAEIEALGWEMDKSTEYEKNSLIRPGRIAEIVFKDKKGNVLKAEAYNSTTKSVKFSDCSIKKFIIVNKFYSNSKKYCKFNINGINNQMAVTDVINTLGTPSHFHAHSKTKYYLDYFISEDDRRNGITVIVNPADDIVTAVEFSYYK